MWGFDYRGLMCELDCILFQKRDDGAFKVVGDMPAWLSRSQLKDIEKARCCNPADIFPFLENFLMDAEWFWSEKPAGVRRFRSAPWTEIGSDGTEFHLEASAVNLNHRNILMIERIGTSFEKKLSAIQKAREKMHELERMIASGPERGNGNEPAGKLIKSIINDIATG